MGKIKLKDMSWADYLLASTAAGTAAGAVVGSEVGAVTVGAGPAIAGGALGVTLSPLVAALSYGAVSVLCPNPQEPKASDIPTIVGGSAMAGAYIVGLPFSELGSIVLGGIGGVAGGFGMLAASIITLPAFQLWKAMQSSENTVAPSSSQASGEFSGELLEFIESEAKNNNTRINMMLFDRAEVHPQDAEYLRSETKIDEWLQSKLGLPLYHTLKAAIFCPITKNIPDCPVIMTSSSGAKRMCSLAAIQNMTPPELWAQGQYINPYTGETGNKGSLQPSHGTQSIINRLLNRLNEFREEKELLQAKNSSEREMAHDNAIKRFLTLHTEHDSNQNRMSRTLEDSASLSQLIQYIQRKPELIALIRHPEHLNELLTLSRSPDFKLPNLTLYMGGKPYPYAGKHISRIAVDYPIGYDFQNTIEQLNNFAIELKPKLANRRRACAIQ